MIACHMISDMTPHPGIEMPKYQWDIFWLCEKPI